MVGLDSNKERTGMAVAGERKKLKDLIREKKTCGFSSSRFYHQACTTDTYPGSSTYLENLSFIEQAYIG